MSKGEAVSIPTISLLSRFLKSFSHLWKWCKLSCCAGKTATPFTLLSSRQCNPGLDTCRNSTSVDMRVTRLFFCRYQAKLWDLQIPWKFWGPKIVWKKRVFYGLFLRCWSFPRKRVLDRCWFTIKLLSPWNRLIWFAVLPQKHITLWNC